MTATRAPDDGAAAGGCCGAALGLDHASAASGTAPTDATAPPSSPPPDCGSGGEQLGDAVGADRVGGVVGDVVAGVLDGGLVPEELSARVPAEERGGGRDDVRLLVSRGTDVSHRTFPELPRVLRAGDVLVVNTSATLPAAVDGWVEGEEGLRARVVVHFSTRGDDLRWSVELRTPQEGGATLPRPGGPAGAVVRVPGGGWLVLDEPVGVGGERLWWARVAVGDVPGLLQRYGKPIRYGYTERDQALAAYQTVFALPSLEGMGSAEMPSAGRPFTAAMVAELVSRGVQFAPLTLHTGVASAEAHEPPYPERFEVPAAVRALESAVGSDGGVRETAGWTDLVVTPERGVRVVDGLLTGLHEPQASHLLMLEAIAGRAALARSYAEALRHRYLWHEFGDVHLILPAGYRVNAGCSR